MEGPAFLGGRCIEMLRTRVARKPSCEPWCINDSGSHDEYTHMSVGRHSYTHQTVILKHTAHVGLDLPKVASGQTSRIRTGETEVGLAEDPSCRPSCSCEQAARDSWALKGVYRYLGHDMEW